MSAEDSLSLIDHIAADGDDTSGVAAAPPTLNRHDVAPTPSLASLPSFASRPFPPCGVAPYLPSPQQFPVPYHPPLFYPHAPPPPPIWDPATGVSYPDPFAYGAQPSYPASAYLRPQFPSLQPMPYPLFSPAVAAVAPMPQPPRPVASTMSPPFPAANTGVALPPAGSTSASAPAASNDETRVRRILDELESEREQAAKYRRTGLAPGADTTSQERMGQLHYVAAKLDAVERDARLLGRRFAGNPDAADPAERIRAAAAQGSQALSVMLLTLSRAHDLGPEFTARLASKALAKELPDFAGASGVSTVVLDGFERQEAWLSYSSSPARAPLDPRQCIVCRAFGHRGTECPYRRTLPVPPSPVASAVPPTMPPITLPSPLFPSAPHPAPRPFLPPALFSAGATAPLPPGFQSI